MRTHITLSEKNILEKLKELKEHYGLDRDSRIVEHLIIEAHVRVFKGAPEVKIDSASGTSQTAYQVQLIDEVDEDTGSEEEEIPEEDPENDEDSPFK